MEFLLFFLQLKEELEAIDKQIDDKARQIAEEKVLEYLEKIEGD